MELEQNIIATYLDEYMCRMKEKMAKEYNNQPDRQILI